MTDLKKIVKQLPVPEHPMPRPSLKLMELPVPKGQEILRIETFRDPSPRKFKWQFWVHNPLPKIYDLEKGEQPINGIEITGVNKVVEHTI